MRGWVQAAATLLQNSYLGFAWTQNLYQGPLKKLCGPGLNCHSCPSAVLSCPVGMLQHFSAAVRPSLRWGTYRFGFYVVGFLMAMGLFGGRFGCSWLCPFGFLQEALHRIPFPKVRLPRFVAALPYAVLAVFVLGLPLLALGPLGHGDAWFCRILCPAGTLEAGGLFFLMPELVEQIGPLFVWKVAALAAILGWAVATYRPYCRALCPLGAIYGMFNRRSVLNLAYQSSLCTDCRSCVEGCKVGTDPRRDSGGASCLRCFACAIDRCPTGALRVRLGAFVLSGKTCDRLSTPIW